MGADVLGGHGLLGPALDQLPAQGIGHVGVPEAADLLDHTQVDAAAARGAGLPLHLGEASAESVQQAVVGQGLLVDGRRAAVGLGTGLKQVTVVVPLDVVDAAGLQNLGHGLQHVVEGLGVGQVQDQLIALQLRVPGGCPHDPLRMVTEGVRIRIDHLRLEPEAELHPQFVDIIN